MRVEPEGSHRPSPPPRQVPQRGNFDCSVTPSRSSDEVAVSRIFRGRLDAGASAHAIASLTTARRGPSRLCPCQRRFDRTRVDYNVRAFNRPEETRRSCRLSGCRVEVAVQVHAAFPSDANTEFWARVVTGSVTRILRSGGPAHEALPIDRSLPTQTKEEVRGDHLTITHRTYEA